MARRVLGARERTKDDPTLAESVAEHLRIVEQAGKGITIEQATQTEEAIAAEGPSPVFRFATASELETTAQNLARRLKRGDTPSDSDLNASLVMIMDAEDQRRILFEQRMGVRTPDPLTGRSSLDNPDALDQLGRRTGVDDPRFKASPFTRNIREFFNIP